MTLAKGSRSVLALGGPILAAATFALTLLRPVEGWGALLVGAVLVVAVFAAVYHAEVVAHRLGEPFGTLVLAVAVTVIEVALIVSLMLQGGPEKAGLARDTVFAAVMIVCNGIVGLCLLAGGARHGVQGFRLDGALAALAILAPLTVLTLILPNFTTSTSGPTLSPVQLGFAGLVSLGLYGAFVFVQTVRHRDFFLPPDAGADEERHASPPSNTTAGVSLVMLLICLVAVVGMAKGLSPTLEGLVRASGAPAALLGILIAGLVLLPEGVAAYRAARANRLQTSMNLALGSALATIGLTVPAVAIASLWIAHPLQLGLGPKESILLALTLLVSTITLGVGRTTVLQGIVHTSLFVAFVFYVVVP